MNMGALNRFKLKYTVGQCTHHSSPPPISFILKYIRTPPTIMMDFLSGTLSGFWSCSNLHLGWFISLWSREKKKKKKTVQDEILHPCNAIIEISPVIIPRYGTTWFWYVREQKRGPTQKELTHLSMCSWHFSWYFYKAAAQWAEISPK